MAAGCGLSRFRRDYPGDDACFDESLELRCDEHTMR